MAGKLAKISRHAYLISYHIQKIAQTADQVAPQSCLGCHSALSRIRPPNLSDELAVLR